MPSDALSKAFEKVRQFDSLPDDAVLQTKITALLLGCSERTVRYHPELKRVQLSRGRYGQRVGDIRKLCREGIPQQAA